MVRKIESAKMGRSDQGWLRSIFHFSFADYYNPKNMSFGVLRVLNDDLVSPGTGFDTHPHRDMEIVSYVVDGELTHGDSMGNRNTISRGHVQYMSAGTGIYHSEHNLGDETARFLQIWILSDERGYKPAYGDHKFDWDVRKGKWFHFVSGKSGDAPIRINQDANFYALELESGWSIDFKVDKGRQAYLLQIEGISAVNGMSLGQRDALESLEENISIKAVERSHFMLIEMARA